MSILCGCYYHIASTEYHIRIQKHYLPLISSTVHSTILSTTSRTTLTQKFTNPSVTTAIKECIYTFPLYDGVSVVSFTCRIGKRVLRGLVKEKQTAKKIFDDAVSKGETAGLLEQTDEAADVFSTKLGNIPAGGSVIVEIEYVGELKHHETEGIRFTIPTKIAPRYGAGPAVIGGVQAQDEGGIRITVDVNMPEGSFIKGVQSPSHPIAVSMGTVSTAATADPTMSKASATLSLGSAALEKDFVLIVQSKDVGVPKAILETHPTIRNHRALMATLVPKFSLPPSRPEIVFVADRSGSMQNNMQMLISAMKVFLKSIPVGVKFNICSFGSSHTFLWQKSQGYSQDTLQKASNHLVNFRADYGGTETFAAIKATIERRFKDIPLEIILLTDGDIWQQEDLFKYVNEQVEQTNGNIRIFPLGIGNGVSHSLIEGLARAGNGFAQAVQDGERLDNCVVRMLRGALSPHITDYTLEVKYDKENDEFELIDKVTEGMKVLLAEDAKEKEKEAKPTISLFDTNVNPEKEDLKGLQDSAFWLPDIPFPKLHQAPHKIPTLFAFSRTSVYLLLSPETIQRNPTAVILRATSTHGPLALEIPIESLARPAETIHQLAAKKAVQDLEEGRGWIYDAKDQNGVLVKERYPSCFDELVKKEAVRLGEKFQIAGKWCSFVAVAANDKEIAEKEESMREQKSLVVDDDGEILPDVDIVHVDMEAGDLYDAEEGDEETDDGFEMVGGSPSAAPAYSPSASAAPQPSVPRGSRFRGSNKLKKSATPDLAAAAWASQPSNVFQTYGASAANAAKPQTYGMSAGFGSSNEKFIGHMPSYSSSSSTSSLGAAFGMPPTRSGRGGRGGRGGALPPSIPAPLVYEMASNTAKPGSPPQLQPPVPTSSFARSSSFGQAVSGGGTGLFGSAQPAGYAMHYSTIQPSPPAPPPAFGSPPPPPEYKVSKAHQSRQYYGPTGDSLMMDQSATSPYAAQSPPSIGSGPTLFGGIMAGQGVNTPAPVTEEAGKSISRLEAPAVEKEESRESASFATLESSTNTPAPPKSSGFRARRSVQSIIDKLTSPETAAPAPAPVQNTFLKSTSKRLQSHMPKRKSAGSRHSLSEDYSPPSTSIPKPVDWSCKSLQEKVARLIELQTFEGSWPFDVETFNILGLGDEEKDGIDKGIWVTLLVVKWLEILAVEEEGVWSMVVEKARAWLESQGEMGIEGLEGEAEGLVRALV